MARLYKAKISTIHHILNHKSSRYRKLKVMWYDSQSISPPPRKKTRFNSVDLKHTPQMNS